MKILWMNNVGDTLGGTLHATKDMLTALYDAEHTVALPRPATDVVKVFLGPDVVTATHDEVRSGEWDAVVGQNVPAGKLPRGDHLLVYYAHSTGAATQKEAAPDVYLSVSHWLADQLRLPANTVLHQPVTVPKKALARSREVITFGRLCTPNKAKWDEAGWRPYWDVAKAWADSRDILANWQMVGGPEKTHKPSLEARSLLHSWDVLLYSTSKPESFGRVVREAQRCGCYPIVDGKGGTAEQVGTGSGAVVQTPEDLPEALDYWWEHRDALVGSTTKQGNETGSLDVWRQGFLKKLQAAL